MRITTRKDLAARKATAKPAVRKRFVTRMKAESTAGKRWKTEFAARVPEATATHEVTFYGEILPSVMAGEHDVSAKSFETSLAKAGEAKKVTILANSPGGDYGESIQCASVMGRRQKEGVHFTFFVAGMACSGASIMALRADRVVMDPGALIMVHRTWAAFPPMQPMNSDDLRRELQAMDRIDEYQAHLLMKRTGCTKAKAMELLSAETWFTAKEAMAAGIAHAVLDPTSEDSLEGATAAVAAEVDNLDAEVAAATAVDDVPAIEAAIAELEETVEEIATGTEEMRPRPEVSTSGAASKSLLDIEKVIEELDAPSAVPDGAAQAAEALVDTVMDAEDAVLDAEEVIETLEGRPGENPDRSEQSGLSALAVSDAERQRMAAYERRVRA